MPKNVEVKARANNFDLQAEKAAALADKGPFLIPQDDTFFACKNGRLKLRVFSPDRGELIFYRRTNQKGPKTSFYVTSPTASPDTLRESLSLAYGEIGRVRKIRTLFLVGRTRIHLDRVEGLGDFIELEVVLSDGEDVQAGEAIARDLMQKLGISPDQLIDVAYVDFNVLT